MAEKEQEQVAAPEEKKRGLLKPIIIVAVVLGMEGGTILLTMKLAGGPTAASGLVVTEQETDPGQQTVEQLIVEYRFPNTKTGRTYLYDLKIVASLKRANLEAVRSELTSRENAVHDEVRTIIASADPKDLNEPGLETLRRQVHQVLKEMLGDEDLVTDILIPRCTPYRTDL